MHDITKKRQNNVGLNFGAILTKPKRIVIIGLFGCANFHVLVTNISSLVSLVCYLRFIRPIITMLRR